MRGRKSKYGMGKVDYGMRYVVEGAILIRVAESVCMTCGIVAACPRRKELDQFGDPIRLFATQCGAWQPYQDKYNWRENGFTTYGRQKTKVRC